MEVNLNSFGQLCVSQAGRKWKFADRSKIKHKLKNIDLICLIQEYTMGCISLVSPRKCKETLTKAQPRSAKVQNIEVRRCQHVLQPKAGMSSGSSVTLSPKCRDWDSAHFVLCPHFNPICSCFSIHRK